VQFVAITGRLHALHWEHRFLFLAVTPKRGSLHTELRRIPRHHSHQSGAQPMLSRQRYVGAIPHLRGKTAFVRPRVGRPGQVMVQFEDPYLQEARGWWQFPESDFVA
jgi:hypothetical protein